MKSPQRKMMKQPGLTETLRRTPANGRGLSSVWVVVLVLVVVQVLNDCFGWLEDSTVRLFVGFVVGAIAMLVVRAFRGGR